MADPFYYDSLKRITRAAPSMPLADRQRLAAMGRFAQQEGVDIGMYGDRDAEGYGQMLDDLDARQPKQDDNQQLPAWTKPLRTPPPPSMPFATPVRQMEPGMFSPDAQYGQLQGMAKQATGAWENEMDSRVAQNREMRRMEHEKELERMRQEAILKKLQGEQQMMMMQMKAADAARRGDNRQTFVPGKGFVPSWMM